MVKSSMIVATVICITANMATAKPLTPDYSSLGQGGMAQTETKQNGVRELFNGQRQLVVKLLQRPLSIPGGDVAQKATGGTAAHVQIVAIDKATGEVVDNFGVTGSFDGKSKAKVFSETNLDKYNMKKPCGIYEMSMEDYYAARTRSIAQITGGAVYEPYNGVGLMNHAVEGFVGGFVDGDSKDVTAGNSIINGVAGAIEGVADATHIYDESQRHNFGVHSDDEKKMSFPIINCQAGGDIFVKNLEGLPTVVPVEKYVQPGEKTTQSRLDRDNSNDKAQYTDLESSNIGDQLKKVAVNDEMLGSCKTTDVVVVERERDTSLVGVRGWCHCWDRTALPPLDGNGDVVIPIGLLYAKARVWGNNPLKHEENGSVFTYVLCRKCGKVYKNPDSASRRNKGEDPDFDDMYDIIFYDKHHQATSSARETKELAWQAVDRSARLRSLPDGEIVISGLCGCPKPLTAPVLMSAADGPSVCLICGKICTNPLAERYDR